MGKQTIGEFLAMLRRAKGFKQQEVADRLGISNRTLSAWERGTALPDILLLPALAELYGVTADEILNGERKPQDAVPSNLSAKSESRLLKSKLGRFTIQACVLTGIFFVGLILFFLGFYYDLVTIVWIGWQWWLLLLYTGLATTIVSAATLIAFWKGAESANDDENELYGKFCILLRRQTSVCAYLSAGLALVFAVLSCFLPFGGVNQAYRFFLIGVFLLIACLLFFGGTAIYRRGLGRWGGESARELLKKDRKTWKKTALFGLIPLGFAVALTVLFTFWRPTRGVTYFEAPTEAEFIREMESFKFNGVYFGWDGAPEGEELPGLETYYFPLSELAVTAIPYGEIDLGHGFTCYFNEDKSNCTVRSSYQITHGNDVGFEFIFWRFETEEVCFYNIKYKGVPDATEENAVMWWWEVEKRGEGMAFIYVTAYDYSEIFYCVGAAIVGLDALACIGICCKKRQKIDVKL